jgi:hypothetical protein
LLSVLRLESSHWLLETTAAEVSARDAARATLLGLTSEEVANEPLLGIWMVGDVVNEVESALISYVYGSSLVLFETEK